MSGAPSLDSTALAKEVARLENALAEARDALYAARCDEAGIHHGDIVIYKGVQHRIVAVDFFHGAKEPWALEGNPIKKNGEFSERRVHIYKPWTMA